MGGWWGTPMDLVFGSLWHQYQSVPRKVKKRMRSFVLAMRDAADECYFNEYGRKRLRRR